MLHCTFACLHSPSTLNSALSTASFLCFMSVLLRCVSTKDRERCQQEDSALVISQTFLKKSFWSSVRLFGPKRSTPNSGTSESPNIPQVILRAPSMDALASENLSSSKRRGGSCGNLLCTDLSGDIQGPSSGSVLRASCRNSVVNIYRRGQPLGIRLITYKRDFPVVEEIYAGGAVRKDGRIKVGDQLLEANGVSLLGLSWSELQSIFNRQRFLTLVSFSVRSTLLSNATGLTRDLQMCLPSPVPPSSPGPPESPPPQGDERSPTDVSILRFSCQNPPLEEPFGLALEDHEGLRAGVYVKEVMMASDSSCFKALHPGDQILKVEDDLVTDAEHTAILLLRHKSRPSVVLWVARHNEDAILPSGVSSGMLAVPEIDPKNRITIATAPSTNSKSGMLLVPPLESLR